MPNTQALFPYLLRRLCYSILVLWGVATLVFLLFNVLPVSPARLTLGQQASASLEAARATLRSDKPLLTRYGFYLNDLSPIGAVSSRKSAVAPDGFRLTCLDDSSYLALKVPFLGRSYSTKHSVSRMLGAALPGTLVLALVAMLLASVLGIGLGILAALKKGTFWDTGVVAASVVGSSIPFFLAGLVIAYIFGSLGVYTGLHKYERLPQPHLVLHNLVLPAIALGIRPMAIFIQLTRSAMLDVLSQDYICTAYAKGLSKGRVVLHHALPNALTPVVKGTQGWFAELLAGVFFIEFIFGRNGIGRITVDALNQFDLPVVTGAVLLTALIFIIVKLLSDVLCRLMNPRVRR